MRGDVELPEYGTQDDDYLDPDEEDYEAELAGILISTRSRHGVAPQYAARRSDVENGLLSLHRRRIFIAGPLLKLVASVVCLASATIIVHRHGSSSEDGFSATSLICPNVIEKSSNDKNDEFDVYIMDSIAHRNKTLKDFRTIKLDGWGITLQEVKELLRPWKEEVFVNSIQSGDVIYESACGIGMNLLISAEILREYNITGLTVSGNDYVGSSIEVANSIWDEEEARQLAHKAFFCQADSTRLDYFVPDSSFDFVYTGYIDPIIDPLSLCPSNMTQEEKLEQGVKLCSSGDKKDQRLATKAQDKQNEWFAAWIHQLVRIAKPGKAIAIESGAESLCTNPLDWGGVDKSWWKEAIETNNWDVDKDSLRIYDVERVGHWRDMRYHVHMRKNG